MLMLPASFQATGQTGPRVAVQARDPVRAAALAALIAAAGHEVVGEHDADLVLSDRPSTTALPVLIVSDAGEDVSGSLLPAGVSTAQLAAALPAVAAGLLVRLPAAMPCQRGKPMLTPRELEILACLSIGLSNKSIARRLGISQHTVKFHLEAVFAKLSATSRAEAVAKGLRTGLIEL